MKEIKIFIASTGTDACKSKAEELSRLLDEEVTATLWEECFKLGETNIEVLERAASDYDFCVVLLTAEDLTRKKGKDVVQPRDNLIYEFGLFTGALGRRRAIGIVDGIPPSLPTDWDGMVLIRHDIQSDNFAEIAKGKVLAHIIEHGAKIDKDKELGFLYRATNVFTYPCYPNSRMGALNKIAHRERESFEEIEDVVKIIRDSLEDYLSNCIPGVSQGHLYIGYQYYLGDGVEINSSSIYECKDKSSDEKDVDGKFVMGVPTKIPGSREWQIGRVSPGYDESGNPLSVCATVFKQISQEYKPDTTKTTDGPTNDYTPGELSLYTCPIVFTTEHGKACLGVLSISGNKKEMIDEDMKNRINFSSMLISYSFSIYAKNLGELSNEIVEQKEDCIGIKISRNKDAKQFRAKAIKLRKNIAAYFEKKFIDSNIHRMEGNGVAVCQNKSH